MGTLDTLAVRAGRATTCMSGKTFLDTNILVYAASAGCARVFTEDLNAGQTVLGVAIENPLG